MAAPPRRKVYPSDVYTWISVAALFFSLVGIAIIVYRLSVHYNPPFLGG